MLLTHASAVSTGCSFDSPKQISSKSTLCCRICCSTSAQERAIIPLIHLSGGTESELGTTQTQGVWREAVASLQTVVGGENWQCSDIHY